MRDLPDPGFAGDDGAVAEEVGRALTAYDEDPAGRHFATLAVVQRARLLVPVVATLAEVEYDAAGLARDKTSDMATVLLKGRDGRLALLAFTGLEPLRRWDPHARPVPVGLPHAARAALHDGAEALVLDVAGPVSFVIETDELRSLAEALVLTDLAGRFAWVRAPGETGVETGTETGTG